MRICKRADSKISSLGTRPLPMMQFIHDIRSEKVRRGSNETFEPENRTRVGNQFIERMADEKGA